MTGHPRVTTARHPFLPSGTATAIHYQKSFSGTPADRAFSVSRLELPKPNPVRRRQDVARGERWIGYNLVGRTAGTSTTLPRGAREGSFRPLGAAPVGALRS
jgi:hypothetical protein